MKGIKAILGLSILAAALVGCSEDTSSSDIDNSETETNELSPDATHEERIEHKIRETTEEFNTTSVNSIEVNEDMGTGEGNIVLIKLSFDAYNEADRAKSLIDIYSNELGVVLADYVGINQVVVFWEVPYLQDKGNLVKYTMEPAGDDMAITDKWFDPSIFE